LEEELEELRPEELRPEQLRPEELVKVLDAFIKCAVDEVEL
jgi:hypothetical protein